MCKRHTTAIKTLRLHRLPRVLLLHIKVRRGTPCLLTLCKPCIAAPRCLGQAGAACAWRAVWTRPLQETHHAQLSPSVRGRACAVSRVHDSAWNTLPSGRVLSREREAYARAWVCWHSAASAQGRS